MRDIAVLVPSRGRPGQLGEMIDAALGLASSATDIIVAIDHDDPQAGAYAALREGLRGQRRVIWVHGPRASMAGWTNNLARRFGSYYAALASLGDDHFPLTTGWDTALLDALALAAVPVAFGNDRHQRERLPTAPVIPSRVVAALGWMCLPGCAHYFIDNAWRDLGAVYVPEVEIEHRHPDAGKAADDATYREALPHWAADQAAYEAWRAGPAADDIAAARAAAGGL